MVLTLLLSGDLFAQIRSKKHTPPVGETVNGKKSGKWTFYSSQNKVSHINWFTADRIDSTIELNHNGDTIKLTVYTHQFDSLDYIQTEYYEDRTILKKSWKYSCALPHPCNTVTQSFFPNGQMKEYYGKLYGNNYLTYKRWDQFGQLMVDQKRGDQNSGYIDTSYRYYHNGNLSQLDIYSQSGKKLSGMSYFEDGSQKTQTRSLGGDSAGYEFTYWHPTGELHRKEYSYVDSTGTRRYETISWHPQGKKHRYGIKINNKETGYWPEWYPNGQLKSNQHYVNGKKEGPYEEYHPNGNLKSKGCYYNGLQDGVFQFLDSTGQYLQEIHYYHGRRYHYVSWNKEKQVIAYFIRKEGLRMVREDEWHWHNNGIPSYRTEKQMTRSLEKVWEKETGWYRSGKVNYKSHTTPGGTVSKSWYENGQLGSKGQSRYSQNRMWDYYMAQIFKSRRHRPNSKRVGTWKEWTEEGKLKARTRYHKGQTRKGWLIDHNNYLYKTRTRRRYLILPAKTITKEYDSEGAKKVKNIIRKNSNYKFRPSADGKKWQLENRQYAGRPREWIQEFYDENGKTSRILYDYNNKTYLEEIYKDGKLTNSNVVNPYIIKILNNEIPDKEAFVLVENKPIDGELAQFSGTVTDRRNGEPLVFCQIVLYQDGQPKAGAQADFDANFTIKPLEPGNYHVEVSYVGYSKAIGKISFKAGENAKYYIYLDDRESLMHID